jgi:ABC-type glycerol-3-phosphate transport system permease component
VVNLSLQASRSDEYNIPVPLFPFHANLNGYLNALRSLTTLAHFIGNGRENLFQEGVLNSLIVATSVMILTMLLSVPSGYALARFDFPFRTAFFFLIISQSSSISK